MPRIAFAVLGVLFLISFASANGESLAESASDKVLNSRTIAILDSGINQSDQCIRQNVIASYDFSNDRAGVLDTFGHGTRMAHIAINGRVHQATGCNPNKIKLIDAKVISDSGLIETESIIEAIHFSARLGANVINMSFSGEEFSPELQKAISHYHSQGILFVASAGNEGRTDPFYPGAYNNVISVGAKDATGKISTYSNRGDWVDLYLDDSYLEEPGFKTATSELTALLSHRLVQSESENFPSFASNVASKHKMISASGYKLNSINSSLFQDGDENDFLSIHARYLAHKASVESIEVEMMDLQYGQVDKYPVNFLPEVTEVFVQTDNNSLKIFNSYILLLDMFSAYLEVAHRDEYTEIQDVETGLSNVVKALTQLDTLTGEFYDAAQIDNLSKANAKVNDALKRLKQLAKSSRGDATYIGASIRKLINRLLDVVDSRDRSSSGSYYTSVSLTKGLTEIEGKLERLKGLKSYYTKYSSVLKFATDTAKEIEELSELYVFSSLKLAEYLTAVESLAGEGLYDENLRTELNTTVIGNASYLLETKDDTTKQKKYILSLITYSALKVFFEKLDSYGVASIKTLVGTLVNNIPLSNPDENVYSLKKLFKNATPNAVFNLKTLLESQVLEDAWKTTNKNIHKSISYVFKGSVEEILIDYVSVIVPAYMYHLYIEMIQGMESEAWYSNNFGYLTNEEIESKAIGSVILRKFGYQNNRLLLEMATTKLENGGSYGLGELSDSWEVTEAGATYSHGNWEVVDNLKKGLSSQQDGLTVIIHNARELIVSDKTSALNGEKGVRGFISDVYRCGGDGQADCTYGTRLAEYFLAWDNMAFIISNYQSILSDMASVSTMYDDIAIGNNANDTEYDLIEDIREDADVAIKNSEEHFRPVIQNAIKFEKLQYMPILTKPMLERMNQPIARKDFFPMAMKILKERDYFGGGIQHPLNPYKDELFIERLLGVENGGNDSSGTKITSYFSDIENEYESRRLTLNDVIWALYAKYNGIVDGNNGKYLGEENITRGEAFKVVTNLLNGEGDISSEYEYLMNEHESTQNFIDIHPAGLGSSVFKSHAAYLINRGIVHGKCTGTGNERTISVEDKLSVYEAATILFRIQEKVAEERSSVSTASSIGEKVDSCPKSVQTTQVGQWFSPRLASIPSVSGGQSKRLSLSTRIKEEDADNYFIYWEPLFGGVSEHERSFKDGYLNISVTYEAPKFSATRMVPVDVYLQRNDGESARKIYYINVLENGAVSSPDGDFNGSVSSSFNQDENTFSLYWNYESSDGAALVQYSFDNGATWKEVASIGASTSAPMVISLPDVSEYSSIQFRIGNGSAWSSSFDMAYEPYSDTYNEMATELPEAPVLLKPWPVNQSLDVNLKWRKVVDSRGNDNARFYEVMYSEYSSFSNYTIVRAPNTPLDVSDPDSYIAYNLGGLENEEKFYFKVRAINDAGVGDWSNAEETYIQVNELPEFDAGEFYPLDNSVGISKTPRFQWEAFDGNDDDELIYRLRVEEDINELINPGQVYSQITVDDQQYQWGGDGGRTLKPGTTYYWQVQVSERGRTKEYYGGSFPASSIMSFTTEESGPDLIISQVQLLNEITPGNYANFDVTVQNIGSEQVEGYWLDSFYIKSTGTFEFEKGSNKSSGTVLYPGQSETVSVSLRFDFDTWTSPSGRLYDNILEVGDTTIRFEIEQNYNEANVENNSFRYSVNYVDKGRPKFTRVDVANTNGGYYRIGSSYSRMVCYGAVDDILLSRFTVEYQLDSGSDWVLIDTVLNDDEDDSDCTLWTIPDDESFVTENLRFRVRAYDSDTTYSQVVTEPKIVYSNDISGEISNLYLSENKVGATGYIQLAVDSVYPIKRVWIELVTGRDVDVYDVTEVGQDTGLIEFTIPNDDFYASDTAYLNVRVYDTTDNRLLLESERFVLQANLDLPTPFKRAINLYPEQKDNTESDVLFVDVGDTGLVHYLYEETVDSTSSRASVGTYYYRQYDIESGALGLPVKVADSSMRDATGNYTFQNNILGMAIHNSKVFVLKRDSQGRLYMGVSNGVSGFSYFYVTDDSINSVKVMGFVQDKVGNLYLYYRATAELTEDRRYRVHEVSGSGVQSSRILVDEYFSGNATISSHGVYFSGSGKFFSFDENLNIESIYEVTDDGTGSYKHEFKSDAADYLFVYNRDQKLILQKSDGVELDITPTTKVGYFTQCRSQQYIDVSIVSNMAYMAYCAIVDNKYTNFFSTIDLVEGTTHVWELGKVKDDDHFITKVATSVKGHVAMGTLKKGTYRTPYLAFAQFDVVNKSFFGVDFDDIETFFELGSLNDLSWKITNAAEIDIASIQLSESFADQRQLLASIDGSGGDVFGYTPVGLPGARTLEIEVVDALGNVSVDRMVVQVVQPVTVTNFYADRTFVSLGDTIRFDWSVTGGDQSTLYKIYRRSINGGDWEFVASSVGVTEKSYLVDDFVGEYEFKVATFTSEFIWGNSINVEGTLFDFDYSLFSPTSTFTPDENGNVRIKWGSSGASSDGAVYTLFFKGEGESEFDRYNYVTQSTNLPYPLGDNQQFSWYVVATIGGYSVSSDVFSPQVSEEHLIEITGHQFTSNNGIGVLLSLSSSIPVDEYHVYREVNGVVEFMGSTKTGEFSDGELLADAFYKYYISGLIDGVESRLSEAYQVETPKIEAYDVTVTTVVDGLVPASGFTVSFSPSIEVQFEQYRISWGSSPSELSRHSIVNGRNFSFPSLAYNESYYAEIVGLDVQGNTASSVPAKLFFTTEFDSREIDSAPVLSGSSPNFSSVVLSWSESSSVDGYNLYRKSDSDDYQLIHTVLANEYTDSGALLPDTEYSYKVRAFNGGDYIWSEPISVTTLSIPDDFDSDNDGLPDLFELKNDLDPDFNSANEDADGDGQTNLDEFFAGSDLNIDDYPPLLVIPEPITVNSTGVKTPVELGVASAEDAKDGVIVPSVDNAGPYFSGRNILTWTAEDRSGNVATAQQIIDVIPQVTFELSKSVREGDSTEVTATLNGSAVEYPVTVPFRVLGTAETDVDHDLKDGQLIISEGVTGTLSFNTFTDDIVEGIERILISMSDVTNAIVGSLGETTISIYEVDGAPQVELKITQGERPVTSIVKTGGAVDVVATLPSYNLNSRYSFEWISSSQLFPASTGDDPSVYIFDPIDLSPGVYELAVRVVDSADSTQSTVVDTLIHVMSEEPELSVDVDTDGDGTSDFDEGWGDVDGDRIPDFADVSDSPNRLPVSESIVAQSDEGTQLILGKIAFTSGDNRLRIDLEDAVEGSNSNQSSDLDNLQFNSGLFNFEILGLELGSSVRVVLPQVTATPEGAFYYQYVDDRGWTEFVVDEGNSLHSAPGSVDACPSLGDDSYSHRISEGFYCVQLTIEDGGVNDADGQVNGVIKHLGGVAVSYLPLPVVTVETVELESNQHSMDDGEKLVMAFQLHSDSVDAEVSSISLKSSGDLDEVHDIGRVTIYIDENFNTTPEPAERLSTSGYSLDDGSITFELPDAYQLQVGRTQFLITYQF